METGQPYILKLAEGNWRDQLTNWYSNTLSDEERRTLQAGLVGAVGGGTALGLSAHRARRRDGSKRGVLGQVILGMLAGGASMASLSHLFSGQISGAIEKRKADAEAGGASADETPAAKPTSTLTGAEVGPGQTALGADLGAVRGAVHRTAWDNDLYGAGVGGGTGLVLNRKIRGGPAEPWTRAGRIQRPYDNLINNNVTSEAADRLKLNKANYDNRFKPTEQVVDKYRVPVKPKTNFKNQRMWDAYHAEMARVAPNDPGIHVGTETITKKPEVNRFNPRARIKATKKFKSNILKEFPNVTGSRGYKHPVASGAKRLLKGGILPGLLALGGSQAQGLLRENLFRDIDAKVLDFSNN